MSAGSVHTYLRDHLTAAAAEQRLFRRAVERQRHRPHGAELTALEAAIREDRERLQALALRFGARESRARRAVAMFAERLGRLKRNGSLTGHAPLSDLVEIEALRVGVTYKWVGWRGLLATEASEDPAVQVELYSLMQRAREQALRLDRIHDDVALAGLGDPRVGWTSPAEDSSYR